MKLYFKPAELLLTEDADGRYLLSLAGELVAAYTNSKAAISEYNKIRRKFEKEMPALEPSPGQRLEWLRRFLGDSLVQHNSFKPPETKKASRKTRTFR
jgi:hypothetical protein